MAIYDDTSSPVGALPRPRLPAHELRRRLRVAAGAVAAMVGARPAATAAAVAGAAALWAVACSALVFPHLSDNNDEAAYLLQADALRAGHLFPPAVEPVDAFRPWLSGDDGERYISKYTPVQSAVIALVRVLTGTDRAALGVIAAATVAACYLLARELLGSRRQAVLAAGFLVASPLFLVLSATYLAYVSTLALLMGFAGALLAGVRLRSRTRLAAAGFLLGVALFARPWDAVLFATPFAGWWLWSRRVPLRQRLGEARWVGLGAALPLAAMLAYFQATTGSFLRPPFTLLDSADTLGFGVRRMFPEQLPVDYTPAKALLAAVRLAALTGFWSFGGLVVIGLIAAGLRWQRGRAEAWLGLVAITVPVGYAFFWGSYGSTEWGGPWRFGPFYWFAILAPTSILGAAGFRRLWRWDRVVGSVVAVGACAVSAFVVARALDTHQLFSAERHRLHQAARAAGDLDNAVVFLPELQGPWLLQPFSLARNATFDGPVIWALDGDDGRNLAVLRQFPGRTPYRVVAQGSRSPRPPDLDFRTTLVRLEVVGGRLVPTRSGGTHP